MSDLRAELREEWQTAEKAVDYLRYNRFELRPEDLSWRPPAARKKITPRERRAIEYLLIEHNYDGLLTDRQHAQRAADAG